MFRATKSPIFRSTFDCILLPTGDKVEMEVPSQSCHRSAAISVYCTKAVYTLKSAPEDGRVCRPKHIEQIQIDQ